MATILLAKAFFQAGYHVQSFPLFGVERRGAPVEAYLRLDRTKILVRTHVYTPDHVVVLDHTRLGTADVTRGLKRGGWILLNAPEAPQDLASFAGFHLAFVDATRIALQHRLGTRTENRSNYFWFIHHLAMALNLCHLTGQPAFKYEGTKDDLVADAVIFCLRGLGMRYVAIKKYYKPNRMKVFTRGLLG